MKTAGSAAEQANQIQDLQTVNKINTLVILPFESAPLTQPVAQIKNKGVFVTVVDRWPDRHQRTGPPTLRATTPALARSR